MYVLNRHHRTFPVPAARVGALIDTLASPDDALWPRHAWPRMAFDRPLSIGAVGGHGPIRYSVESYEPGKCIGFRFSAPKGFNGWHGYDVAALDDGTAKLTHTLEMDAAGFAVVSWTLVFRPLHDALIEDSLDCAARALTGQVMMPARWSGYVRLLRGLLRGRRTR